MSENMIESSKRPTVVVYASSSGKFRIMKGSKWLHGTGIEIGAHSMPIKDIRPIYVDRFFEYAGSKCLADVISDATVLPFRENSLDYIASSHLIEHLPNPILTLSEWCKLVRPGGIIFMVVPDRRFTFDHRRERTRLSHLIDDFEQGTAGCDPTHIEDFTDNVDLHMMMPHVEPCDFPRTRREQKQAYLANSKDGREVSIHFHVFEKEDVIELVQFMKQYEKTKTNWKIIEVQEKYPPDRGDGFLIVLKVGNMDADSVSASVITSDETWRFHKPLN